LEENRSSGPIGDVTVIRKNPEKCFPVIAGVREKRLVTKDTIGAHSGSRSPAASHALDRRHDALTWCAGEQHGQRWSGKMIEGSCLCGAVKWRFDGVPEAATACNCTACRRYGALRAHHYEDEGIHVTGQTRAYFDGLDKWEDLPRDGRCVADQWF
jgi:hypothetical protein